MLSLARATVRMRWTAFVGTFLALTCGVALTAVAILVIAATTTLPEPTAQRYAAAADVLVPHRVIRVTDGYGDASSMAVAVQPGLPASLVAAVQAAGPAVADHTFYAQLRGGPSDEVGRGWSAAALGGYRLIAGQAPQHPGQIVVGGGSPALVGRSATVQTATGTLSVTVTGVTAPVAYEHALFFTDAQAAGLSPAVDALALPTSTSPAATAAAEGALRRAVAQSGTAADTKLLAGGDRDQADPRFVSESAQLVNVQTPVGLAAAVAGVTAVFVVTGAFALSVAQRRRELALLRLIGATRSQARRLICIEALLIGLLAGVAGGALGAGAAPLCGRWMAHHGVVPSDLTVPITWWALSAAAAFGLLTAVVGALTGAWRAGRIAPAEALLEATVERGSRLANAMRWVAGAIGLGLAAVLLCVLMFGFPEYAAEASDNFTITLTVAVAFSVLAGVLTRPLVRALTLRPRGAVWTTARHTALMSVRRTASVGSSVAVVVALTGCLVGGMDGIDAAQRTDSNRQLSAADYVITPAGAPGLTQSQVHAVQSVPGLRTLVVTPVQVYAEQSGATLVGYPAATADPASLAALGGLSVTDGSVAALGPDSIVLAEGWPGSPGAGSRVRLWLGDGTPRTYTVAAVFRSVGNGVQAYVDTAGTPASALGTAMPTQILASTAPGADPVATRDALGSVTRDAGAQLTPAAQAATAVADANARDTRTAVLMILGLSVLYALLALANTLVMTVADRRRDLALLRLAGATRRQTLGTVLAETLMCVVAGAAVGLLATLASIGGTWVALRHVIGPAMPVVIPWTVLAALTGTCLLVAAVSVVVPTDLALRQAGRRGLNLTAAEG